MTPDTPSDVQSASDEIDPALLDVKNYPEEMFMDIYGNGGKAWDQKAHPNLPDVKFRCRYIRADLVQAQRPVVDVDKQQLKKDFHANVIAEDGEDISFKDRYIQGGWGAIDYLYEQGHLSPAPDRIREALKVIECLNQRKFSGAGHIGGPQLIITLEELSVLEQGLASQEEKPDGQ